MYCTVRTAIGVQKEAVSTHRADSATEMALSCRVAGHEKPPFLSNSNSNSNSSIRAAADLLMQYGHGQQATVRVSDLLQYILTGCLTGSPAQPREQNRTVSSSTWSLLYAQYTIAPYKSRLTC